MSKYTKKQKVAVALGAGAIVVAGAGSAFAYWTSSGHGAGSATAGTSTAFTVTADSLTLADLTPGGGTDTIHYTVHNGGTGSEYLTQLTFAVAGTNANGSPKTFTVTDNAADPACTKADFSVGGEAAGVTHVATVNQQIAAGQDYTGTVSLQMLNSATNQDSCQGATVPLYLAAS